MRAHTFIPLVFLALLILSSLVGNAQGTFTRQWLTVIDSSTTNVDQITTFSNPTGGCSADFDYPTTPRLALSPSGNQVACIGMSNCNIITNALNTADGSNAFQNTYTGSSPETGVGVAYDKYNNLFSLGGLNVEGPSASNFLRKYNSTGSIQFTNIIHNYVGDDENMMRLDTNGRVLLANVSYNGSANVHPLYCYSNTDSLEWTSIISDYDWYYGYLGVMEMDDSGNTVFTGKYQTSSSPSTYQVVVRKVNPAGTQVWEVYYSSYPESFAERITIDKNRDIYMLINTNAFSAERLVKFSGINGSIIWDVPNTAGASDLKINVDTNVIVMSNTSATPYPGTYSQNLDCINHTTGSTIWSKTITNGYSLATDVNGNVYLISTDTLRIYNSAGTLLGNILVSIPGYTARMNSIVISPTGNFLYLLGERSTTSTNKIFVAKYSNCPTVTAGIITGASMVTIGYPITLIDTTSGGTWSSINTTIATVGSTGIVTGVAMGVDTIKYSVTNVCGTSIATKVITVNPTTTTAPCYVPSSGLIAWYPFSENAIDSTGHGNNGTVYGATLTTDRFGNPNSAYKFFGGDTSYIQTPINNFSTGNFTICAWAKCTQNVQNSSIIASRNALDEITGFGFDTTNAYFYIATSPGSFNTVYPTGTSFNLVDNQWHYYAAIYKGDTMSLYIDNNLRGQYVGTFTSSIIANFKIGLDDLIYGGELRGFIGSIDDIGFWNRALTSCELLKLYNASCAPLTAGAITGSSSLCSGSNFTLTDTTSGGTWSSSNTAIATVGSTGIVTGVSAGTATINYTKTNVCGSASSTKAVTINPIPLLSSTLTPPAICNGTLFSYTPASSVTGVTFAWSRSTVSGISNPASTGTGNIIETLVNTTPSPINVTYVYTLSASGCSNAQNVIVIVNPTPMLSSALTPPSICSGTLFSYSPVSTMTGLSFAWSRSSIAGISNPAATGTGNINETLFNTTSSPVTVTYSYTLTVYGCLNVQNVTVTVNPLPNAGTISGASTLCTGATTAYTDASPGGLWSSTNGNASLSGIGIATGITAGTDTIEYIVINTCGTATAAKAVTVNSSPSAGTITGGSLVCVGSAIPLADATTGGIWSSLSTAIATVGSSGIVSGVLAGTATIIYTISNTCGSAFASQIITVNPLPVAGTITGASTVCTGSNITLTDAVTGGAWSATNSNAFVSSGGIVNGSIAGSDTIKYTVTNTCGTASASKTITISPLPIAGSISGLSSVCPTATITLTDGAPGGLWTTLNGNATVLAGVVTGVVAGFDTILYTVTNSCGAASAYQFITINPLPVSGSISGSATLCVGSSATMSDSVSGGSWSASNSNALVSSGGIVYAMAAGVDTIAYTVTNSCGNAIALHAITINPLPNAGIISGTSTVCIGTPDTLSDPVPGGAWSATNSSASVLAGIVTGAVTGMDTIVYTVSNACGSASKSKIISINPMPNAGAISGKDTVCMETTITLTESATGGSWSTVLGNVAVSTTGVVIGVNYGLDTVLYTVINSCGTAVAKMSVQVLPLGECISGLSIINSEASLMVIPNPNKGAFTIKGTIGTTADEQVTIEVINLLGQVIYRSQVLKENGKLDQRVQLGSSLANGMYLLSLKSASENKVFHIVIEQ